MDTRKKHFRAKLKLTVNKLKDMTLLKTYSYIVSYIVYFTSAYIVKKGTWFTIFPIIHPYLL